MWPYATRGSRFMGDVSEISPSALEAEDFSTNAVSIKLWLPEKLVAAIDVLCDQHDPSRPDTKGNTCRASQNLIFAWEAFKAGAGHACLQVLR